MWELNLGPFKKKRELYLGTNKMLPKITHIYRAQLFATDLPAMKI
jgi:hypothetical protein